MSYKEVATIAKQTDMSERQIERWLRLRRAQDKPSTLIKFCENRFVQISFSVLFEYISVKSMGYISNHLINYVLVGDVHIIHIHFFTEYGVFGTNLGCGTLMNVGLIILIRFEHVPFKVSIVLEITYQDNFRYIYFLLLHSLWLYSYCILQCFSCVQFLEHIH